MRVKVILQTLTDAGSLFFRPVQYSLLPPLGMATNRRAAHSCRIGAAGALAAARATAVAVSAATFAFITSCASATSGGTNPSSGTTPAQAQDPAAQEANAEVTVLNVSTDVISAIMAHTPFHASPRSVPLSNVVRWAGLQGRYELTPTSSYPASGNVTIRSTTRGNRSTNAASATVPWLDQSGDLVWCLMVPGTYLTPDQQFTAPVTPTPGACTS